MQEIKFIVIIMLSCIMSICGFAQNSNEQDLLKEANLGNSEAQYKMGKCLGDKKEYTQAFEWWSKAAAQGFAKAEYNVGVCYENGMGVEKNTVKAFEWYSKAATQGFSHAEYNVSICYGNGIGVEKNNIKSCTWMSRAANNGSLDAQIYWMKHYRERDGDASLKMKYILLASRQGSEEAKELFRQVAGMPYAQLDSTYRSKIKTYVGEYTLPTLQAAYVINLSNCHCRYQYYEVGDVRIYHGIFEVQSNESVRTKEGKTIPLFTIKGHFKDGYRDGIWVVELHHGGSGHWLKVPYRDGNIDGLWKEYCGGEINAEYENNILSKFSCKYKNGSYTEAYLDDEGYMHGEFIFHGKKYIYKGNFIHGISEDYSELNIQTGDIERKIISATRTYEYRELCLFDSILGAFMHHTFQRGLAMISWDGKRASPTYKGKLKYRINKK